MLLRDNVISKSLQWEGIEDTIVPYEQGSRGNEAMQKRPSVPLHAADHDEDEVTHVLCLNRLSRLEGRYDEGRSVRWIGPATLRGSDTSVNVTGIKNDPRMMRIIDV